MTFRPVCCADRFEVYPLPVFSSLHSHLFNEINALRVCWVFARFSLRPAPAGLCRRAAAGWALCQGEHGCGSPPAQGRPARGTPVDAGGLCPAMLGSGGRPPSVGRRGHRRRCVCSRFARRAGRCARAAPGAPFPPHPAAHACAILRHQALRVELGSKRTVGRTWPLQAGRKFAGVSSPRARRDRVWCARCP